MQPVTLEMFIKKLLSVLLPIIVLFPSNKMIKTVFVDYQCSFAIGKYIGEFGHLVD